MSRRYSENPSYTQDPAAMSHAAWSTMIPKLRAAMDAQGLAHIAIWLHPREDEHATFEPLDPAWRRYRVVGGPAEDHLGEAALEDLYATPVIALAAPRWEWFTGSACGLTKMNALPTEDALVKDLVERLVGLYRDPVYTFRLD